MEIVHEAAQFLRVLFTPCELYLDKHKLREKYKANKSAEKSTSEWVEKIRNKTWRDFDNPPPEEPEWSLISKELWDELDDLNWQWQESEGRLMFVYGDDEGKAEKYWDDVKDLLKKHLPKHTTYEEEDTVMKNIFQKLRWYRNESASQYRLIIPILTPKMLDCLAANIAAGAQAYEEVSEYIYYNIARSNHV